MSSKKSTDTKGAKGKDSTAAKANIITGGLTLKQCAEVGANIKAKLEKHGIDNVVVHQAQRVSVRVGGKVVVGFGPPGATIKMSCPFFTKASKPTEGTVVLTKTETDKGYNIITYPKHGATVELATKVALEALKGNIL